MKASHPFQFIVNVLSLEGKTDPNSIPVTQDASSSAYQIMSYLLLDVDLAMRTNLIPSDGQIKDVYSFFLDELKEFLPTQKEFHPSVSEMICSRLTRKLVKTLFMPLIYGKTVISMAREDDSLSKLLSNKECYLLASLCFKFWSQRLSLIHI